LPPELSKFKYRNAFTAKLTVPAKAGGLGFLPASALMADFPVALLIAGRGK
jgi:hypothetical protein